MKKNDSLKSLVVIVTICLVIAVAMAAINSVTAPKIEEANQKAEQEALQTVLSGSTEFVQVEGSYADSVTAIYRDAGGKGYAVMVLAKGYDSSNPMKIAIGFDTDGNIIKCHVVSCSGETTGIGTKVAEQSFLDRFAGKNGTLEGVDAISGATISSSAFIAAVEDAMDAVKVAKEAVA